MASTTNNGWATPDDTSLVKDGASAIRTLGSAIDTSVGTGLLAWTAYTPTFTNFTLGNGSIGFAYAQLGKIMLIRGGMTLGTTSSFSGTISISLPVNSLAVSGNPLVGSVRLTDVATQNYYGFVQIATASTIQLIALNASTTWLTGSTVNTTTPFTWGTGDDIRFFLTYQGV